MIKTLKFLAWPIVTGFLLALLILQTISKPELIPPPANTSLIPYQDSAQVISYSSAVKRAAPAVVNVYTSKVVRQKLHPLLSDPLFRRFFNQQKLPYKERIERSLGSGVIIGENGYLLTNNHVIAGASEILVSLHDGRESLAKVVGTDPDTDLAVLQINLAKLNTIPLGDPASAEVGDVVLAIGNPYGFGQTVTQGIISATNRYGLNLNTYENFIQTDAAINPGNSGGALIDARGYLLGINTAIYSKSGGSHGIGLAIPADYALKIMRDIVDHGQVIRGWLGIEVAPMPVQLNDNAGKTHLGLSTTAIEKKSPADIAGLRAGDIIVRIGDMPVAKGRDVMYRVAMMQPGQETEIAIVRDSKLMLMPTIIGTKPR
jgi:serine protease DegS